MTVWRSITTGGVLVITLLELIDDFLADMRDHRDLRPNTLASYRYDLKMAAQFLTGPLAEVTVEQVEQLLASKAVKMSTRMRRIASLNRFFAWATRQYPELRNPVVLLEPIKRSRQLPRPIRTASDRTAIDTAIAAAPQPYRLILTILRETGMRCEEALDLRLEDVLLDPGREGLRVREPKNRSERIVILTPRATPKTIRGLRTHLKHVPHGTPRHVYLFTSNRGTRVSYDALRYQWQRVCTAAELVDATGKALYTLHQLRHTRGTELFEDGQSLETAQRVLGHRDPRSTLGYAELNDQQIRAALEHPPRR
jgi:integrase/recombinase XerD